MATVNGVTIKTPGKTVYRYSLSEYGREPLDTERKPDEVAEVVIVVKDGIPAWKTIKALRALARRVEGVAREISEEESKRCRTKAT